MHGLKEKRKKIEIIIRLINSVKMKCLIHDTGERNLIREEEENKTLTQVSR
jgi:hypothetical protein